MSDKLINLDSLLSLLSAEVKTLGGQSQFAKSAGVSQAYVADILAGKRSPGPKILAALGFEKVILYRRRPVARPVAKKVKRAIAPNSELTKELADLLKVK